MTHVPKRLEELIGADVPAEELERLVRVDALLRAAAAFGRGEEGRPSKRPNPTSK